MSMVRTDKSLRMIVVTMMVIFLIMMIIYHYGYFMLTVIISMTVIFRTTMIMNNDGYFSDTNENASLFASHTMKIIMMFTTLKTMVTIRMAIYKITMVIVFILSG
jgi:hypothetical protein